MSTIARYPYNDRKETDDESDKLLYLHRCDYSACRAAATTFFRGGVRLCVSHGEDYSKLINPKW
jgi:hypothetical protein